jgi:hypothetical protein
MKWHDAPCSMKMWAICEIGKPDHYVIKEKFTWHESVAACEANGDHLTSVTSPAEHSNVKHVLKEAFPNAESEKFWIGLNNPIGAEQWKWTDNQPFSYNNWDVNQPGDQSFDEDCGAYGWGNLKWHDAGCQMKMYPVCEYGMVPLIIELPLST